ncbi:MAG: FkbM family methyltransferase [Candidatus Hydrogenedentes bacterium]|nr:FkbM family methyltransferase [Candidatus Hydrogenedentota bacterium]
MNLRAELRRSFPGLWGVLRGGKRVCSRVWRAILRRGWSRNEAEYRAFLNVYAETHRDFFFVQAGANDGVRNDPISPMVRKFNWRGVLIEPQPELFKRLKYNYADIDGLYFENAAVSNTAGTVSMLKVKDGHASESFHNGIASICPERGAIRGLAPQDVEYIEVPAVTLRGILKKYAPRRWDLLQVDTEGYDFEIIKQVDFKELPPKICCYEHRHLTLSERRRCRALLRSNGYLLYTMERDTAAVHGSVLGQRNAARMEREDGTAAIGAASTKNPPVFPQPTSK